jgi:uncharacterized protein YegJ (DUF2314 family)/predicted GIY-YIG superfamily endonuclease
MKEYKIYIYEFLNQYCYIGLTNNPSRRDGEHRIKGSVFQHSQIFEEEIPEMKILEEGLDEYEAQKSEENWCKYYVDNGWTLINKAKMGLFVSSLGGKVIESSRCISSSTSNDLEINYKVCLEEAKKYDYLSDFRKFSNKYYTMSRKYGWDYEWLEKTKPINHGTKELSFGEIQEIASRYGTRSEFSLNNHTLYMKCLSDGSIDELFPRENKTRIKDSGLYSDEELMAVMLSYRTKTEFFKAKSKLYNLCRLRGLLDKFPKRTNISTDCGSLEKIGIKDFFLNNKNIVTSSKYGKKYIFNKDDMSLYHEYKTMVAKVRKKYDKYGILCYKIDTSYVCIFDIINEFIYGGKYNIYKFIDGDFSSINLENIDKGIIDLDKFSKMSELDTFLINEHGEIYSTRHKMIMPCNILNGVPYFCGFKIDRLVIKYFHPNYSNLKKFDIIHKDGNLSNNDITNLDIQLSDSGRGVYKKNFLIVKNIGETNEIYIKDFKNDKEYFLGLIKNEKVIDAIRSEIIEYISKFTEISDWVGSYQGLEFKKWQEKDKKINMISIRVNSNGCYYSEVHKLWKSKIYYKEKEYSLGYFHTFEAGKVLYEEAVMYIKYNRFEKWYSNIESHRERVKSYFE